MKSYTFGTEIVLAARFSDPNTGRAAQPTDVTLLLRSPFGVIYTPPITNPETGLFNAAFTPQAAGNWTARWEATGAVVAASEEKFEVKPTAFN